MHPSVSVSAFPMQAIEAFALMVKTTAHTLQAFGTELAETEMPNDADATTSLLDLHSQKKDKMKVSFALSVMGRFSHNYFEERKKKKICPNLDFHFAGHFFPQKVNFCTLLFVIIMWLMYSEEISHLFKTLFSRRTYRCRNLRVRVYWSASTSLFGLTRNT